MKLRKKKSKFLLTDQLAAAKDIWEKSFESFNCLFLLSLFFIQILERGTGTFGAFVETMQKINGNISYIEKVIFC